MKKRTMAIATLALLLGACNDNTENADQTVDAVDSAVQGKTNTGVDTLVIQESSDIPTLDPGTTYDTASGSIVKNVYETLVSYEGKSLTDMVGVLATEWNISEDGREYRFTLRENVPFHSGNQFSCADAEYTFERNLVTNTSSSGNWFLSESLLGTGANANDDDNITWELIDNAVECDGEVLVFKLPKADPAFLSKLGYYGQSIVDSQHAKDIGEWDGTEATWRDAIGKDITGSPLSKDPSGTGAYKLLSADASNISLEAFDNYWGGAPAIKNVVRQIVSEPSSRVQAFLNGDADIVDLGSREVMETQVQGQPGIIIDDDIESLNTYGFTMNQDLEGSDNIGSGTWGDGIPANFFADEDMRKCFVNAFDYQSYIDQVQSGKGKQLNTMLPSSFFGYDESLQPQAYDMTAAEEHCKKAHGGAAWENGFTLNAAYREGSAGMQTALEILKNNIESLNPKFHMNLVGKQWSEIIDKTNKEAMVYVGWAPDYADPDNFIYTYYHSKGYYAPRDGLQDAEMDAWIDEARSTIDENRREELYKMIAKHASENAYYIQTPTSLGYIARHADLTGYSKDDINPLFGYYFKNLSKN